MGHLSLYRKHRPQTFADVVGQEHVTRTLGRAVAEGRLAHAYLFSGPRGTGKTSTARILAKCLNCEAGPTAEPCNVCASCVEITAGRSLDVVEIDAASHGSVDDARDIREKVAYSPAAGRSRVYIVDECHMLSPAANNALLKVLEEPPAHVVFVFATTEPHKVLQTLLDRCQRYEMRAIGPEDVATRVNQVAELEGISIEPEAVEMLAHRSGGSMRDALSLLDQLWSYAESRITGEDLGRLLGSVPEDTVTEAIDIVSDRDAGSAFLFVDRLTREGRDVREFVRALTQHLRSLFLVLHAPAAQEILDLTDLALERLRTQANRFDANELLRLIDLANETNLALRQAVEGRLVLEVMLVRMARPDLHPSASAMLSRIERLERLAGIEGTGSADGAAAAAGDGLAAGTAPTAPRRSTATQAGPGTTGAAAGSPHSRSAPAGQPAAGGGGTSGSEETLPSQPPRAGGLRKDWRAEIGAGPKPTKDARPTPSAPRADQQPSPAPAAGPPGAPAAAAGRPAEPPEGEQPAPTASNGRPQTAPAEQIQPSPAPTAGQQPSATATGPAPDVSRTAPPPSPPANSSEEDPWAGMDVVPATPPRGAPAAPAGTATGVSSSGAPAVTPAGGTPIAPARGTASAPSRPAAAAAPGGAPAAPPRVASTPPAQTASTLPIQAPTAAPSQAPSAPPIQAPATPPSQAAAAPPAQAPSASPGQAAPEGSATGAAETGPGDQGPDVDLEKIKLSWEVLLEKVKKRRIAARAMLLPATPVAWRGGELVLEFDEKSRFHRDQMSDPAYQTPLSESFHETFGIRPRIRCVLRESGGGRPAGGPAGRSPSAGRPSAPPPPQTIDLDEIDGAVDADDPDGASSLSAAPGHGSAVNLVKQGFGAEIVEEF
jgi:DNA polymerase-3 subunit gamma/tau